MIEKILAKKYVIPAILLFIMLGAFAVRFYHFHDWLYFKMDQARDAFTISNAVKNGPGELPLLGARAGATEVTYGFLNLGPIFYYFQYLSGVIFHSTDPAVFAYPDLFFSIAVLPLLYVFLRIYFKRHVSLALVFLYAFSFLVIQYSRFAWNPNSLPFFTILSFLSLLKFLNPDEEKHRKWWMILWAAGLAVGSQLHFVGFFSLVGVSALLIAYHYELWKKEAILGIFAKENLKKTLFFSGLALAVFLVFYTPVIISDSMKNWENSKNFIQALSSKPSDNTFLEKFSKNLSQEIRYYTLVATSFVYPKNFTAADYLPPLFTVAVTLAGMYLAVKKIRATEDKNRRNFLILILLWFLVYYILCIPLAYSIRPRFFLFTFAVPFIFLGLVIEFLEESRFSFGTIAAAACVAIVFFGNIWGTSLWFSEQAKSQKKNFTVKRTLILKNKDGVTLGQLEKAADYIDSRMIPGNRLYLYIKPEHVRPIRYVLNEKNPNLDAYQMKLNGDPKAQYFAIVPGDMKAEDIAGKIGHEYKEITEEQFGQIKILEIELPGRTISSDFKPSAAPNENAPGRRIFWKDVFGIKDDKPDLGTESADDIKNAAEADSGD